MRKIALCCLALPAVLLSACGKKEDAAAVPPAPASAPASTPAPAAAGASGQPDFGGVTRVSREVEAVGSTQELAVLAALQMAVAQVNGVRVASQMQAVRAGMAVSVDGQPAADVRSEAFVQKLLAASQGAVTGFEILSQQEIDKVDEEAVARVRASDGGYSYTASSSSDASVQVRASGQASAQDAGGSAQASRSFDGSATSRESATVDARRGPSSYASDSSYRKMRSYWKVRVRAEVAQYRAPDDQGRPKIVVALPRTQATSYPIGDAQVASAEVAQAVRSRLSDILTRTQRFTVLDRELGAELQAEVDHIQSGNVRVQDAARVGQQLAADLLLVPTIERFEYPRQVQKLRMSDRELVSYSGGGRVTLRLLNAATGQVIMSDSFEHKLADADPSTMPRNIDGRGMAAQMMDALSGQIGTAIVTEIFPVTVVSLDGQQVVLSQGGDALRVGERWQAVALGHELKDPQTGRSLGRDEMPVGTIRIERVASRMSYGAFEDSAPSLATAFKPGDIQLRHRLGSRAEAAPRPAAAAVAPAVRPAVRATAEPLAEPAPVKAPAARKDDDKNW